MTEAETAPDLSTFFDELSGGYDSLTLPDDALLSRQALHDHPFMWALDVFVFAGPQAAAAVNVYASGGRVSTLDVTAYRILASASGVMSLRRAA